MISIKEYTYLLIAHVPIQYYVQYDAIVWPETISNLATPSLACYKDKSGIKWQWAMIIAVITNIGKHASTVVPGLVTFRLFVLYCFTNVRDFLPMYATFCQCTRLDINVSDLFDLI